MAAPPYRIASVDHALQLLLLLRCKPTVRVAEAADELAVARSTAHRLLGMLVYRDFAVQDKTTRAYLAGPVLIEIGMGALARLDVRRRARPHLERLVAETGETASLQILEGRDVRFVDSVESPNAVRVGSRAGVSLPAHASSGGKALLALLPKETIDRMYPRQRLDPVTNATTTSRAELLAQLADARQTGYSVNHAESEPGLVAVGVALANRNGQPVAALTIAGPASRMTNGGIERCVTALRVAATELTGSLYY